MISWTGEQADALRRALRITHEAFAAQLGIGARTVAYWRQRPDTIPQQQMQEILDAALERASEEAKARFAQMIGEARTASADRPGLARSFAQDTSAQGAGLPAEPGHTVALLDDLIGADMANRPDVVEASWVSGTASTVITDYLFSSPVWQREEEPLAVVSNTAGARIRAVAQHLMDIDFQFGGGYVRRILLFYFQSDVMPLLQGSHPENTRREIFGAAAEVTQLLGWSAYDAGRHGAAQRYFMQGLRLATEAGDAMLGGRLLSNLSHQANYLGRYDEA